MDIQQIEDDLNAISTIQDAKDTSKSDLKANAGVFQKQEER